MSSPSLDSLPPQQGQAVGDGRTTRSRGRWAGRGARTGWPRGGLSGRRVRPSLSAALLRLGGILAGGGDQLAELELQLVDQLAATLGGGAVLVALEPGDQQLEMRHHRLGAGGTRLGLAPRQLLGRERGAQRGDVVEQVVRRGCHAEDGITAAARQVAPKQPRSTLSRQLRPPCPLWVSPVDSVERSCILMPLLLKHTWRELDTTNGASSKLR